MDTGGTNDPASSLPTARAIWAYVAGGLAVLLLAGAFLAFLGAQGRTLMGSCSGYAGMQLRTISQAQPAARAALAATTAADQAKALDGVRSIATCPEAIDGRHDVSPQTLALTRQLERLRPRLDAVAALRERAAAEGAAPLPAHTLRSALQPVLDAEKLVPDLYAQLDEPTMVAYAAYARLSAVAELLLVLLSVVIAALVGLLVARRWAPATAQAGRRVRRPTVVLVATIAGCALAVAALTIGYQRLDLSGMPWPDWPHAALMALCAAGGTCVLSLAMCRRSAYAWWMVPMLPAALSAVEFGLASISDDSWLAPGSLVLTAVLGGLALLPAVTWRLLEPAPRPARPRVRWRGGMVAWPLLVLLAIWFPLESESGQHLLADGVAVMVSASVIFADLTAWRRGLLPMAFAVLLFAGASTYVLVHPAPAVGVLLWFTAAAVLGALIPVVDTSWKRLAARGPATVPMPYTAGTVVP